MSQHRFESVSPAGDKAVVTIGYDRRLDYVHCVVENATHDVLYSNLDDENAGTTLQDVRYYESVLEPLGIKLPQAIYKQVERDQSLRVGNRQVVYNQDGSIVSESTLSPSAVVREKIGLVTDAPINAPVHSVWCPCPLCVDWVSRQSTKDAQPH